MTPEESAQVNRLCREIQVELDPAVFLSSLKVDQTAHADGARTWLALCSLEPLGHETAFNTIKLASS